MATYATARLTLGATALVPTYGSVSDVLTYRHVVTNSGSTHLLGSVTVANALVPVTCPPVDTVGDLDDYLDPGESVTCRPSYAVQTGDVGSGATLVSLALASVDGVESNDDGTIVPYNASPTVVGYTGLSAHECGPGLLQRVQGVAVSDPPQHFAIRDPQVRREGGILRPQDHC